MLINRICIQTVYHNRSDGIDLHSMDSNQNGTLAPWLAALALIPTSHFVYIMSTFVDYPIPYMAYPIRKVLNAEPCDASM